MLTPTGYSTPTHHTAADMAHSTHSTQPALRPHRTTPRAEDNPLQTHRPHSYGLCSLLSEGPYPGLAQRHVNADSPVQTALIIFLFFFKLKKNGHPEKLVPSGSHPGGGGPVPSGGLPGGGVP